MASLRASNTVDDTRPDLDKTMKNLNLTTDEVNKFNKAFKDPEFIKMFAEYAKEMADPKVKEETDLYLRQLESEGRSEEVYGKGTILVVPTEGFVLKTLDASGQKVFVNVCTSDKMDKMSMTATQGPDGRSGRHVEIPLSLSHKKTGQDKTGKECLVFDFVVHPETVITAMSNKAIKKLLVETALEQIEKAHQLKLETDYTLLKIKYKGTPQAPKPHVLAVRPGSTAPPGTRLQPASTAPVVAGIAAQVQGEIKGTLDKPQPGQLSSPSGSASRSTFKFPNKAKTSNETKKPSGPEEPGHVHATGEVTPEWNIIHRGQVDLADTWSDTGRTLAAAPPSWPQYLVVKVTLPGCTSAAALQLDVSTRNISVVLPARFKLEAALPFPVDETEGKAKFDKAKHQLEVTLPTLPPPKPKAAEGIPKVQDITGRQANVEADEAMQGNQGDSDAADTSQVRDGGAPASGQSHPAVADEQPDGGVQQTSEGTGDASSSHCMQDKLAAGLDSKDAASLTENQRKWLELHAQQQEQAKHTPSASCTSSSSAVTPSQDVDHGADRQDGQDFLTCCTWQGAKTGYVFTTGVHGTGYYKDHSPSFSVVSPPGCTATGAAAVSSQAGKAEVQAVRLQPRLHAAVADDLD